MLSQRCEGHATPGHRTGLQANGNQQTHPRECAAQAPEVRGPVRALHAKQRSLLNETLDADLQAVSEEISQNVSPEADAPAKQQHKRQPRPANQPRREMGFPQFLGLLG